MKISEKNAKKLEYLWRPENKALWISTFIKIIPKEGGAPIPFVLTPEQLELVNNLGSKNIINKGRQQGCSVVSAALSLYYCCTEPNSTCAIISHSQESCNSIFQKLKNMYYTIPTFIRPELKTNNRQALEFKNGGSIVCLTAGNKDCLRGATISKILHCSEIAFWKDINKQMTSITQALTDTSTLILESTANGYNEYSDMFFSAINNENAFKPFFFSWVTGGTLFKKQYKQAVKEYKATHNNQMLEYKDLDEEERHLLTLGATYEQLIWRRAKVSISGIDKFHQEYPASYDEAFISTGKTVFDKIKVGNCLLSVNNFKSIPRDNVTSITPLLKQYIDNALTIWTLPKSKTKYYIGCDLSQGLGLDYSVVEVFNQSGEQCAEFRSNTIKPYEMADIIYELGCYYSKGLLCIETASGGSSVIERLRYNPHNYMNMVKYKRFDQCNKEVWVPGFYTDAKSKSLAINDLREFFDKGMIQIKSKQVLEEMRTYAVSDKGVMSAPSGLHDDCVAAMWLVVVAMKYGFYYS